MQSQINWIIQVVELNMQIYFKNICPQISYEPQDT